MSSDCLQELQVGQWVLGHHWNQVDPVDRGVFIRKWNATNIYIIITLVKICFIFQNFGLTYSVSLFSCGTREPNGPSLSLDDKKKCKYDTCYDTVYRMVKTHCNFLSSLHHLPCDLVAPEDLVLQHLPVEKNKQEQISYIPGTEIIISSC